LAGILQKAGTNQTVVGIPVLKGFNDMEKRLGVLNGRTDYSNLKIWNDDHFGGYAKKTANLLTFMNETYEKYALPTDYVYTAKMMYAVMDAIDKNKFPPGSHIICIHTGGLQGNESLPPGSLIF